MSDDLTLSDDQRGKLLRFIDRFDQVFGDADFDSDAEWSTPELLALALRAAGILGLTGEQLGEFFEREFNITGMGESEVINDILAIAMLANVENRIRCAAGGRN